MLTEKNASIDPALLYGYVDSFEEYDQVRQYYWKLIFSYSIYKVIDNLRTLQKLDDGHLGTSEIADLLKINAFNLKRLSVGKGQTTFFVKLIDSLYRYGVNIMEVKYKPGIVLITYARYIQAVGQD